MANTAKNKTDTPVYGADPLQSKPESPPAPLVSGVEIPLKPKVQEDGRMPQKMSRLVNGTVVVEY